MTRSLDEPEAVSAAGLVRVGGPPVCIAHRGASKEAPENTIAAFRKALERRADAVELDLRATSDGVLVCVHDATLDRTTNGSGPVADTTLAEIRKLDAGSWKAPEFAGESVPTFGEALAVITPGAVCTPELKVTGIEKQAVRIIAEAGAQHAVIIVSFHDEALARVRELAPDMPTGWIVSRDPPEDRDAHAAELVGRAAACGASLISASFTTLTHELLAAAHNADMAVWVWTVDSEEPMGELLAAGVDGITSNVPHVLRRVIDEVR
jgi:glycerophosphoryl diester phosphodiesterase